MNANARDYVQLHFIIILWGFTAILGLLVRIPAPDLVFYRTLIASFGLLAVIAIAGVTLKVGMADFFKLTGNGVLIAAHWILFFESARISTASVSLAGLSTISFWTSLMEPVMNRKKIDRLELLLGLVVVLGLYLIFHFEFSYVPGLIMSLGSALFGSLFTVINANITHRHNQFVITFYELIAANVATAIFILVYAGFVLHSSAWFAFPSAWDWFYLALLGLVCTVYPFSMSIELMKRMSAFMVNLSVNLEPVYGIILAVIIFGDREKMNPGFYAGTLVILLSVIIYPVLKNRREKWKLAKKEVPG